MAAGTLTKIVKLREIDGVICASSRDVARDFRKEHKDVLETIRNIIAAIKESGNLRALSWFREDTYFSEQQKQLPCFDMTEEGFALVIGRFTGKRALDWQIVYHTEFQRMKALLGRTGAPTAHALFEPKVELEHRENVVAFQGPPKPQSELFDTPPQPVVEPIPAPKFGNTLYHYPNDDLSEPPIDPSTPVPWPTHTQAEWNDLPLAARQEWWEKYASAVQLKNYNDDLLFKPDEDAAPTVRSSGDRWTDRHEGVRFQVINDFNSSAQRRLWVTCNYRGTVCEIPVVAPDGSPLLICINEPFAPIEVIERNYDKLGHGSYAPIGKATLRHALA